MADNYCFIEDGKIKHAQPLPESWGNCSGGFKLKSDAELKTYGWLPMIEVKVPYDQMTHYQDPKNIDIQADQVVFTDVIVSFTEQELAQNKINDAHGEISRIENLMTPRLIKDAHLGITDIRNGRTGIQEMQRLEDLIEEQRVIIRG